MEPILLRLLDENKILLETIEALKVENNNLKKRSTYESEQINEVAGSFAKAKAEFRNVLKNNQNKHFNYTYADLSSIMNAVDDALSKQGLTLYYYTRDAEGGAQILHTRLLHASGQWLETRSRIIPKNGEQQEIGKAMSYQRRYQAMCLLGIAPSNDPDDDDGAEEKLDNLFERQRQGKPILDDNSYVAISKDQVDELQYELRDYPELARQIMEKQNLNALADMDKTKFIPTMARIRELKAGYNSVKK